MKKVVEAQRLASGEILLWQPQRANATVITASQAHAELARKYARPAAKLMARRGPPTNLRPAGPHDRTTPRWKWDGDEGG